MGLSFWQVALVAIVFLLLFGRGKIPQLMGDLAQGIKSFKKGMHELDQGPDTHTRDHTREETPRASVDAKQ